MQIVESRIRRIASAGETLVKIINEILQANWPQQIKQIVNEVESLVESKIRILLQGGVSAIIKVISEAVALSRESFSAAVHHTQIANEEERAIEYGGLFYLAVGLIKVISEEVRAAEAKITNLAGGLIKIINEELRLVEGIVGFVQTWTLRIINEAASIVETRARIRGFIQVISETVRAIENSLGLSVTPTPTMPRCVIPLEEPWPDGPPDKEDPWTCW